MRRVLGDREQVPQDVAIQDLDGVHRVNREHPWRQEREVLPTSEEVGAHRWSDVQHLWQHNSQLILLNGRRLT